MQQKIGAKQTQLYQEQILKHTADKAGVEQYYFPGDIAEVRLWNRGDIHNPGPIQGSEEGLVAWWRFEDNEGTVAVDAKGSQHGTIRTSVPNSWVESPDPQASTLSLIANGVPMVTMPLSAPGNGATQLMLGAYDNTRYTDLHFSGQLDEIRIWQVMRTPEQIRDNLFRRLIGERESLLAYYTCDITTRDTLRDESGRGLSLLLGRDVANRFRLSTAPVSSETGMVRNALVSVPTGFHTAIDSRPAVQEYGDIQADGNGNLIGVMKRCYAYTRHGAWHLITDFKVGDLDLEWIGQVQFQPQLLGFIEGAPPVPSENLTIRIPERGQNYEDTSVVRLEEAEEIKFSYSNSRDSGVDTSLSIKAGLGYESETTFGVGVPGTGIQTTVEDVSLISGATGKMETSNSWLSEGIVGSSRTTSRLNELGLQGEWEAPNRIQYPAMGRRYVPYNVGFALVQSETADMFAMRLRHPDPAKRVVVALRMRPNPDIPKDFNIIIFPINPRYVKQGSLDGKVGLAADHDYPHALSLSSDSSYFKPIEAYTLKRRIEQEHQELALQYQKYEVKPAGADGLAVGTAVGAGSSSALAVAAPPLAIGATLAGASIGSAISGATAELNLPDRQALRTSLYNTYVWTADGGFFVESQQAADLKQEMLGGAFSLSGQAGIYNHANFTVAKAAVKLELEALLGGHLHLTTQKSQASERTLGVAVEFDMERNINIQSQEQAQLVGKPGPFDAAGNPIRCPGKVDAYRLMTFYLQPDKEHFEDFINKVVDPIWLNESSEPNAVALRQARGTDAVPWRVLHRVTYISRVLPEIGTAGVTHVDEILQAANFSSNYELIRQIEPYVRTKVHDYVAFAAAVRQTVQQRLPELIDVMDDIVAYMSYYMQVFPDVNG